MNPGFGYRAIRAPFALPVSFAMFLAVGTVAAALHGRFPADGVLSACAAVTVLMSFATVPAAAPLLAGIGWLTAVGFSRPPTPSSGRPVRSPCTRLSCWPGAPWPAPR